MKNTNFNYKTLDMVKKSLDGKSMEYIEFDVFIGQLVCEYYQNDCLFDPQKINNLCGDLIYQNDCVDYNTLLILIDCDNDEYILYNFENGYNCIIQNGIAEILYNYLLDDEQIQIKNICDNIYNNI